MFNKKGNISKLISIILFVFLLLFPMWSSLFHIELMGKFITLALLAISLDLIWGYMGLLSLGHAVFFGIGGYIIALSYSFQDGVPSFMTRFNITEIPVLLKPLQSMPLAFVLGLIIPGTIAMILGYFIFKGKVRDVFFAIITIALATGFELLMTTLQSYTGGSNGLMGLPRLPILGESFPVNQFYYILVFILMIVYIFASWFTKSHFGKVGQAIDQNEKRVTYFGYDPDNFKIFNFTISALIAGLAGMLYASMNGFFSPTEVGIDMSTMLLLWVAIGGRGTLMGAVIGAISLSWISNTLSESFPDLWQLALGFIMVLVVLFLPKGVYGTFIKWVEQEE